MKQVVSAADLAALHGRLEGEARASPWRWFDLIRAFAEARGLTIREFYDAYFAWCAKRVLAERAEAA